MSGIVDSGRSVLSGSLVRATGFLALWLALSEFGAADLVVGVLTAAIATWVSLRLSPPGSSRLRPHALARLALRFPLQSIAAGIDVAWRALVPRMPLRPGFVVYQPRLPPGPARAAFCTMMSLLPGTLPCGTDERGNLIIHCLDTGQPVAEQVAADEALLAEAIGSPRDNG